MKQFIKEYSPAQLRIILDKGNSNGVELLKLTLLDLLLRDIICLKDPNGSGIATSVNKNVVSRGKNWGKEIPLTHEFHFLSILQRDKNLEIYFDQYIKLVGKRVKSRDHFRKDICAQKKVLPFLKRGFFGWIFREIPFLSGLNEKGTTFRNQILDELMEIELELSRRLKDNTPQLTDMLLYLRSNILLLKKIDPELLKLIDKKFARQMDLNYEVFTTFIGFEDGFDSIDLMSTISDDWTDSFSDSFFDSDFSDSGCSSCSGCGGCGGCGGCS